MRSKFIVFVLASVLPLSAGAKLEVAATLPTLGALAEEVGGPDVDVTVLSSAKQDPHYVDPRPDLVLKLNRVDLLIQNGLELEVGWLPPVITAARNPRIQVGAPGHVDSSTFVRPLEVPTARIDRAMGDIHPGGNLHFLFDPRAAAAVARGLGERMAALDPGSAAAYRRRAAATAAKLEAVAKEEAARFASLPPERRRIVVYHRSFPYLEDWLGLEQVAELEPKPGVSPDPGHVASVLKTMRARGVDVILQESFYPTSTSRTLAGLAKAKLVVIPAGVEGGDLAGFYRGIAREVHDALAR